MSKSVLDQIRSRNRRAVKPRTDPLTTDVVKSEEQNQVLSLCIDDVKLREDDSRPVNPSHVMDLLKSIEAVGMIVPISVDKEYRLLAGAHRLAALKQLEIDHSVRFNELFPDRKIPVRVMSFSGVLDPSTALHIEIAENEKRRDYSPDEVRAVAVRLIKAGYVKQKGRPKAGERALIPELELIFGKSRATIKRYLAASDNSDTKDVSTATSVLTPKAFLTPVQKKIKTVLKAKPNIQDWSTQQRNTWTQVESLLLEAEVLLQSMIEPE